MTTTDDAPRFRVLHRDPPADDSPLSYVNRKGVTLFLHHRTDRMGRSMYCALSTVKEGALRDMPLGFDFIEYLSGSVAVGRIHGGRYLVPFQDLSLVRAAMARFPGLRDHIAVRNRESITIHEPDPDPPAARWLSPEERGRYTYRGPAYMRPALCFTIVPDRPASGERTYVVKGATHAMDMIHGELDRGRLVDLAVRHLRRLDA